MFKMLCALIFLFVTSSPVYANAAAAAASAAIARKNAEDAERALVAKDMALRKNAKFYHARSMIKHNFSGAKLRYALFNKVDLSGADFTGADLRNATFIDVDLSNTDFRYANMLGTRMTRVKMNGTVLPDIHYPNTSTR